MRIIEFRVKIINDSPITEDEMLELGETLKDMIYDKDDAIEDVTYEIHDDFQE